MAKTRTRDHLGEMKISICLALIFSCGHLFVFFEGGKLAVGFVGCDGGSKDETSPPKNVLSENWTTEGNLNTYHPAARVLLTT